MPGDTMVAVFGAEIIGRSKQEANAFGWGSHTSIEVVHDNPGTPEQVTYDAR